MKDEKTLHLTLKKKWFDMIASGEKKEEYREIKPYWSQRLTSNPIKIFIIGIGWTDYTIHRDAADVSRYYRNGLDPKTHYFKRSLQNIKEDAKWKEFGNVSANNGYQKDCPNIQWEHKGIRIGEGRQEWGAEPGVQYFILEIGDIIKSA